MGELKRRPIGIFDSGLGGLTVFKEIRRLLPCEDLIYLGDTARVPYGTKSPKVVKRYALEATLFLLSKGVKAVVFACNTTSSVALEDIARIIPVPFFGVIKPGAEEAISRTKGGVIGVIGTEATIKSGAYKREMEKIRPGIRVVEKACPLFVPLVEAGHLEDHIAESVAEYYLSSFQGEVDVLILGCTHYPLLKKVISSVLPGVDIVDSASSLSRFLVRSLGEIGLLREGGAGGELFYVTDDPEKFSRLGSLFLGRNIGSKVYLLDDLDVF